MECRWTPIEKEQVDAAFLALCELYRQQVSVALTRIYYRVLEPLPAAEVVAAIEKAICTLKWFPKPVELVDLINGDPEEQAIKAWSILQSAVGRVGTYRSILFEDPKMCAVVKFFGGWEEIGNWSVKDLGKCREEFIAAYKAIKNPQPSQKLSGRGEDLRLLRGTPNLNPWAIVRRNGEIVHMVRVLAKNRSEILDLPERYKLLGPQKDEDHEGGDLVPIPSFIPKPWGRSNDAVWNRSSGQRCLDGNGHYGR